jgi:hypothetical protein
VMLDMWNLASFSLEIELESEQEMCTVCIEHTIGSEIILDTPYRTPS